MKREFQYCKQEEGKVANEASLQSWCALEYCVLHVVSQCQFASTALTKAQKESTYKTHKVVCVLAYLILGYYSVHNTLLSLRLAP